MGQHLCPWWAAYFFDNPLRRIFYHRDQIFSPYVRSGMTVADIGCGMGFNAIALARIVGDEGRVIAADLQPQMLAVLRKRAAKAGVAHRIRTHLCRADSIGVEEPVDFAVAFWVVHETPDTESFLRQVHSCLKSNARFLVVEPKYHVSRTAVDQIIRLAHTVGLELIDRPPIRMSHTALFHHALHQTLQRDEHR
jgi:ubiquinone/menaquinone biosynthesis C-methylase UbiE